VLIAVAIVALALLAWRLAQVFLLVFGALIAATLLRAVGRLLERRARLPERWSAAVALLLVLAALGAAGWLVGDRLVQQFSALRDTLPSALAAATRWLDGHALGAQVLDGWDRVKDRGMPWARLAGIAGTTANALGNLLLILLVGIYLSFDPGLYRRGLLRLVPLPQRPRASGALDAAAQALARWLVGQGVSMAFVGAATGIGLWLLGLPMALPLGIIAALLDFVPLIGPIAAGVVVVVFAFLAGPEQALYAALLCLAIQQVESYLLMPLVQRWAVSLPPVLGLVAVVVFGLLFGVMGIVFATPLIVVLMVLVRKLYVEGVIERVAPGADRAGTD
jgi:predicted PurR-regulated permease PerM